MLKRKLGMNMSFPTTLPPKERLRPVNAAINKATTGRTIVFQIPSSVGVAKKGMLTLKIMISTLERRK